MNCFAHSQYIAWLRTTLQHGWQKIQTAVLGIYQWLPPCVRAVLESAWGWVRRHPRYPITCLTFCVLVAGYVSVVYRYFPEESYTATRGTAIVGSAVYDSVAKSNIVVMELNDRYLNLVGETWPPSYVAYAAMLDDVALYQPASVFLDIALVHARQDEGLPDLIESLCRLHAQKIRVYLAGLENEAGALRLRPELEAEAVKACYTPVGIRYDPAGNTKLALTYPLLGNGAQPQSSQLQQCSRRSFIPSAAYAMAMDFDPDGLLDTLGTTQEGETMALTWSMEPHPNLGMKVWEGCTAQTHWTWELIPRPAREVLVQLLPESWVPSSVQPPCPSHRHVPLSVVADPQTQEVGDWLRRNLQSRHVLIGASVTGVNDSVQSPVHGAIPGIYLHAMALDNLLTYGMNYKQPGGLHERSWWLFFGVALVLGLINYRVYAGLQRWLRAASSAVSSRRVSLDGSQATSTLVLSPSLCRAWSELRAMTKWCSAKLFEIAFSIALALVVFYVMQRWTQYAVQDLAQLMTVVLALQWTGVTAQVVDAVTRVLCAPELIQDSTQGETP